MKKIPLSNAQGKKVYTLVDDEDYERLAQRKWKLSMFGYAIRSDRASGKTVRIHRVINQTPEGMYTDHLNGNRLDNRKSNLRTSTRSQNMMNRKYKNKHGFKGVYYIPSRAGTKQWTAQAGPAGTNRHLGWFYTKEEAALAYDKAAKKLYGNFAKTNKAAETA